MRVKGVEGVGVGEGEGVGGMGVGEEERGRGGGEEEGRRRGGEEERRGGLWRREWQVSSARTEFHKRVHVHIIGDQGPVTSIAGTRGARTCLRSDV